MFCEKCQNHSPRCRNGGSYTSVYALEAKVSASFRSPWLARVPEKSRPNSPGPPLDSAGRAGENGESRMAREILDREIEAFYARHLAPSINIRVSGPLIVPRTEQASLQASSASRSGSTSTVSMRVADGSSSGAPRVDVRSKETSRASSTVSMKPASPRRIPSTQPISKRYRQFGKDDPVSVRVPFGGNETWQPAFVESILHRSATSTLSRVAYVVRFASSAQPNIRGRIMKDVAPEQLRSRMKQKRHFDLPNMPPRFLRSGMQSVEMIDSKRVFSLDS